jgi:hypothetical protein
VVIHWRGDGSSYLLHPQTSRVPRFAFGKYRGHTVDEVMRVESSCLAWFLSKIEGCEELKEAIEAHPRFPAVRESWLECRRKREQQAEWRQGQFSQPTIDGVCEELFKPEEEKGL